MFHPQFWNPEKYPNQKRLAAMRTSTLLRVMLRISPHAYVDVDCVWAPSIYYCGSNIYIFIRINCSFKNKKLKNEEALAARELLLRCFCNLNFLYFSDVILKMFEWLWVFFGVKIPISTRPIHRVPKRGDIKLMAVTPSNLNRFK